ncbi:MAG: glycogen debranching N-terminal domain-containing protein, partial [Candidatus Binatia bacterium]
MDDFILVKDEFYIRATSAMADDRTRVLKHGETFAVFDRYGDIQPLGMGEQGIYREGTRFLSRLLLSLSNTRPLLLSSTVKEDNAVLAVDLTNPDIYVDGRVMIPHGTIHISRMKFLWQEACYEQFRILNYGLSPIRVSLTLQFDADFADVFEVRGAKRERKGDRLEDQVKENGVLLNYCGLDGVVRQTRLEFSPKPERISRSEAIFDELLQPKEEKVLSAAVLCGLDDSLPPCLSYESAMKEAEEVLRVSKAQDCEIYTSNEQFNDWLNRSLADLHMMITDTPKGPYPYAGVPWFSTAFGRDGIIAAMELLWVNHEVARGVLAYLAHTQASESNSAQDAEPGKVLHETRKGEMARLGEIPFGSYYGSVDATPLFVVLAGAYYERTGDRPFIEELWPHVELALQWIDHHGDVDGDGFVEYLRHSPKGLVNQGWKDSWDAVFHADGSLAEGPIALCEVQAYVYAAKRAAAGLARALGEHKRADELLRQAESLQKRFEHAFWCEGLSTYALALDGRKRPCEVRTSNAGHCLFTGIASQEHARRVAETLLGERHFSGWGIQTVASS